MILALEESSFRKEGGDKIIEMNARKNQRHNFSILLGGRI